MTRIRKRRAALPLLLAAAVAALCLAACGDEQAPSGPSGDRFDAGRAFADLRRQVELGPRPAGSEASRELTRSLAASLRRAGLEDVRIQHPERNVVATIPGRAQGYVVVGAHHDTTEDAGPDFVGANDGASGVAVVLELARTLPNPMPGPSVAIALFDAEEARSGRDFAEDGTRGSRQYVELAARPDGERQGSPPLAEIRAMVLFDLVGDCDLQIPLESSSDPALYALFAEAAGGAPFEGTAGGIGDDHQPFLAAGIPALDLIDFTYGSDETPGPYWHTEQDTLEHVCPESLDAVGEAAAIAIPEIR